MCACVFRRCRQLERRQSISVFGDKSDSDSAAAGAEVDNIHVESLYASRLGAPARVGRTNTADYTAGNSIRGMYVCCLSGQLILSV